MFRQNYLPKVVICQDPTDSKWIAYVPGDALNFKALQLTEDGCYSLSSWCSEGIKDCTKFTSIDHLMEALYTIAFRRHLADVKENLCTRTVRIKV